MTDHRETHKDKDPPEYSPHSFRHIDAGIHHFATYASSNLDISHSKCGVC